MGERSNSAAMAGTRGGRSLNHRSVASCHASCAGESFSRVLIGGG